MGLTVSLDESRYDRQERMSWWDQELLAQSKVLVFGAGALGNEIVKNLALVGVGSIVVVDFDRVEASNLSRCVFFRPEDEGELKASCVARRATELNETIEVAGLNADLRTLGTGVALRADALIAALDSRGTRLFVNRMAWRAGRPWVDGAIEALSGVARVFTPPDSCYECTLSDADFEVLNHRQSCRLLTTDEMLGGKVPTTATTSSIVAGLQSQEVIKALHHDKQSARPLAGGVVIDGANNDSYVITYPFREDCQAHHVFEDPVTLEADLSTTFGDVVASLGDQQARVELGDDHLTSWHCTTCGSDERARGVVGLLTLADALCPTCEEPRQPRTTTAVEVPGPLADETIAGFGVRADEVLAVRHDGGYRYVWAQRADPGLPESWW